ETAAAQLDRVRAPYNTNLIAQAAALAALRDVEHVERSKRFNRIERDFLRNQLESLNFQVLASVANFLLLIAGDSMRLYERLVPFGIITRPMEASNMPEGLRVTIGTHEENIALIDALKSLL
ncbi:MAG TPA: aminotransferase class I/II-fold pyridoxal phosphate-dependent enzyme, partial [Acidobacteriota bacterium]|nr:aminotransferase class I/II-fold pyridoxal phosphate-dependent enzyme [Acidobacteriota bacterium]